MFYRCFTDVLPMFYQCNDCDGWYASQSGLTKHRTSCTSVLLNREMERLNIMSKMQTKIEEMKTTIAQERQEKEQLQDRMAEMEYHTHRAQQLMQLRQKQQQAVMQQLRQKTWENKWIITKKELQMLLWRYQQTGQPETLKQLRDYEARLKVEEVEEQIRQEQISRTTLSR